MKTSLSPKSRYLTLLVKYFFCLLVLLCAFSTSLEAAYISVYTTVNNGAISFTGNTLGLNKTSNQNNPGTNGSIGAFITTDTSMKVNNFPFGTTLDWHLNNSTAVLDIPTGSTILHAELIWSGSYGFDPAITLSLINSTTITMTTPDSVAHTITFNPATAQSRVNSGSNGFYVRSADVTSIISALANSGAGTYTVGGVPATVIASENNLNCAGWTLAVVYQNPNMFTSNLTLFVACEAQASPPALVSGFHAPDTGTISSRLFVSALEGDAQLTGDHFLVGATSTLNFPADALSGTNNPISNFFGAQMNTLLPLTTDIVSGKLVASGSSQLDTRGSFGLSNSNASTGNGVSGARQGYDITSVDMGNKITNGQQQLYAQGTTNQDVYTVNGLGIQIQVLAPLIQGVKQADVTTVSMVGDIITYTITLTNIGETIASSLVFTDILPTGLSLVPGSFTVNMMTIMNPDLVMGVPLGNLGVNATTTVVFQAQVDQIDPPSSYDNASTVDYSFIPFGGMDPIDLESQTNTVTVTAVSAAPPVANPDTGTTNSNTQFNGPSVLTNDTGTSISVSIYDHNTTQGGTVVMQPDGTFVYTPPTGFSGTDTFTYTITDPLMQTSMATVTMTVLPLAQNDTGTVAADTPLNGSSVLGNDAGTGLTVTSYDMMSTEGGTIVMQPDGTYVYTPANDFSGTDAFNYTATDSSGNPTTATVTITVLPVAENDFGTTPANTVLNGSTVFTNDMGMGLMLVSYDHTSIQGGTVVMNMMDGTYVYTPPTDFSGLDTFTYTVQDMDGNMSTATVSITVLPVAFNDTGTTVANTPLNQMTSVLNNDLGAGLTVTANDLTSLQNGTIVMQPSGTYLYTPPLNFSGTDSFNYTATDSNGSTTSALVVLTVQPHAMNDTAVTMANTTLIGPSVLANDTGTTLTAVASTSPSMQGGLVTMHTNGTYVYVPPTGFSGIDTFTYTAVDAFDNMTQGTVTITVLLVAVNNVGSTNENIPFNGPSVLTNDIGSGLSVATYDQTTTAGGSVVMNTTGTYTYTPPKGFIGVDTFTYTAKDSSNNTATATVFITVTAVSPPLNFTGVVKKCKLLNKTEYNLEAKWNASPSPEIIFYRIYHHGKIVDGIRPGEPFVFKASCLKSNKAAHEYEIAAVNSGNAESIHVKIKIVRE